MSLVNDMLRDLEKRNEQPTSLPGQESSVKAAQTVNPDAKPATDKSRVALWVVGATALAATGWFLWQDYQTEAKGAGKGPQVVAVPGVTPLPVKPDPVVSKTAMVEVSRVQWAEAEIGGDLVLTLSRMPDVQVVSQSAEQIVLALNDTRIASELPLINSPLLQRMDLVREDAGLLLTLQSSRPGKFAFRVQQNPAQVIIGIVPDPVVAEVAAKETAPEPKPEIAKPAAAPVKKKPIVAAAEQLQVNPETKAPTKTAQPVVKVKKRLTENQILEKARQQIRQGQAATAESLLQQQIASQPKQSLKSRQLLASVHLAGGEIDKAARLLEESLSYHPEDLSLRKLQVRTLMTTGDNAQAIQLLTTQQPPLSKDPEFFELLASAYQNAKQPEHAAQLYYRLLQLDSEQARWWIGLGYALEQNGHYQDATTAYQSGLRVPTINHQLKSYARQRINALAGR